MESYDIAIGWSWEYDASFVLDLEERCSKRNRSTYLITPQNVEETLELLKRRKITFLAYLDRAFDVDETFESIGRLILKRNGNIVNDYDQTAFAIDKATMHLEFLENNIYVPFSIIISPYSSTRELELTIEDLAHLGRPFVIKPANTTGGSIGVVTGAETLLDVLEARKELEEDKYLLQEKILPKVINRRRCWFRCFYVYDKVFLSWWDDLTHLYKTVTPEEEHYYHLTSLRRIMKKIAKVSKLNFFSSEIALRESTAYEDSRFVVVDYVNDMCDMREESLAIDGLPNALYSGIVDRLAFGLSSKLFSKVLRDGRKA